MKRRTFKVKEVSVLAQRTELLEVRESLRGVRELLETLQFTQDKINHSVNVLARLDLFVEVGLVRLNKVSEKRVQRRQYRKRRKAA